MFLSQGKPNYKMYLGLTYFFRLTTDIRQERPLHVRSELVHPAFRERGRAIPQPQVVSPPRTASRVIEGRVSDIYGINAYRK